MRLSEFLLEKTVITKRWETGALEVDAAIKLLNAHCKDSLKDIASGTILWRGMNLKMPNRALIIDSTDSSRTSRDTWNAYQLMMDISTNLHDYPKRSNSVICSTSHDEASMYANFNDSGVWAVFPYDNTDIVVSNKMDFLRSRIKGLDANVYGLTSGIDRFLYSLLGKSDMKTATIKNKLVDASAVDDNLTKIDSELIMAYLNRNFPGLFINKNRLGTLYHVHKDSIDLEEKIQRLSVLMQKPGVLTTIGKKVYGALNDNPMQKFTELSSILMTPDALGLKIVKPGNLSKNASKECWFSGKCVVIKNSLLTEIVATMKRQGMPVHKNLL
jgi:hypothetical protein